MIDDNVIKGVISLGVDYYKGDTGRQGEPGKDGYTPRKGIDYFTQEDIDSIIDRIEEGSDIATVSDIPTKLSDLENDLDIVVNETDPTVPSWAKASSKPTYTAEEIGALPADTVIPVVPSAVSAFTNDAGYLTEHQSLDNYATKSYVEEVAAGIATGKLKRSVIATLPVSSIDEYTIYMIPASSSTTNDVYDEYLYVNNAWEKIGNTKVDLTDYVSTTALNVLLATKEDKGMSAAYQSILSVGSPVVYGEAPAYATTFAKIASDIKNYGVARIDHTTFTEGTITAKKINDAGGTSYYFDSYHYSSANAAVDYYSRGSFTPTSNMPLGYNNQEDFVFIKSKSDRVMAFESLTDARQALGLEFGKEVKINNGSDIITAQAAYNELKSGLSGKQDVITAGNNITIGNNGTISAINTTYTAGNGVSIDSNNVISAVSYTAGNGIDITNNVISTTGITAYELPTATTSTLGGVKVDGETIIINDGVISTTGSSGASYTAGEGIDIDSNNIISNIRFPFLAERVQYGNLSEYGGLGPNYNYYITSPTTREECIAALKQHKIVKANNIQGQYLYASDFGKVYIIIVDLNYARYYSGDHGYLCLKNNEETQYRIPQGNGEYYFWYDGHYIYTWGQDWSILNYCLQINNQGSPIGLGKLLDKITTRIPENTATNGTYKLISSATAGNATYSWVSDTATTYTLPTASTTALGGVKVDGSSITINDGIISATATGGATYTAGYGIDIDSNNVIKTYNSMLMLVSDMVASDYGLTKNEIIEKLLKGQVILHSFSSTVNSLSKADLGITTGQFTVYGPMNSNGLIPRQVNVNSITLRSGYKYYLMSSENSLVSYNPEKIMFVLDENTKSLITEMPIKSADYSGNTYSSLGTYINKVDNLDTRIPANTATNGTFKLQSSTTAGNATYSWVEDSNSGGATYTAGQGININNNTISTVLPVMNPNQGNGAYTLKAYINQEEETEWDEELQEEVPTGNYISTLNYGWDAEADQEFPACWEDVVGNYKLLATITEEEDTEWDDELQEEVPNGNYTQYLDYAWVPDTSSTYVLPTATTSTLGTVMVDGSTITINDGVISATCNSVIPAAPSNDGNYILKCSVSSGTATYSWVSANIGGSY